MGIKGQKVTNRFIKTSGLDATQKIVAYEIANMAFTGKTIKDIAAENNICRTTLYRWKTFKEFNDEVEKYIKEIQRASVADCVKVLGDILTAGKDKDKLKAIEIIYKNQGLLKDVQEVKQDSNINISVDDILNELSSF